MRVVFAHALHFLHFLHPHAFTCITTALHFVAFAFSAFCACLHLVALCNICIFCILRVIAFRCIMQYLHSLHLRVIAFRCIICCIMCIRGMTAYLLQYCPVLLFTARDGLCGKVKPPHRLPTYHPTAANLRLPLRGSPRPCGAPRRRRGRRLAPGPRPAPPRPTTDRPAAPAQAYHRRRSKSDAGCGLLP